MATLNEVVNNPVLRNAHVLRSLSRYSSNLLFVLSVREYDAAPTKTKAITLFETFLGEYKAFSSYPGDFDPDTNRDHWKELGSLSYLIGVFDSARAQARQMNAIERWLTSAGRRIAAAGIFEKILELSKLDPRVANNALYEELLPVDGAANIRLDVSARKQAISAKTRLNNAGFKPSHLGLDVVR